MRSLAAALVALGCASGCSSGSSEACTPGEQRNCGCVGGALGIQICSQDGSGFAACLGCPNSGDAGGAPDLTMPDGAVLDQAVPDQSQTPDLSSVADLAVPPDQSVLPDQSMAIADLTAPILDQSMIPDLTAIPDLALPDLARPDLVSVPDMVRPADLVSPQD